MKDEILEQLEEHSKSDVALAGLMNAELGQVLIWLVELYREGLVKRLKSGAWALNDREKSRRRNRRDYIVRQQEVYAPCVTRDTSPFPRPPYQTPQVGLYGTATMESGRCVILTCSLG